MRKTIAVLMLALASLVAVAEIRGTDDTGVELLLENPAQRIISLAPHITESVFAVGAGEKLVGTVSFSNYPEQALSIPQVGTYKKISYETVAAMQPDLILAFGSGNGWEMINRLRELGFKVYVDEPRHLEDIAATLNKLGILLGRKEQGDREAEDFLTRYRALQKQFKDKHPVRLFYEVWNAPLLTINDQHMIADVIRLCGGRNIFADAVPLVAKVSVETVVRRNPEIIIVSGMGEERPEWLDDWRIWTSVAAVTKDQLYFIPPDILQRHTPRILEGAEQMCHFIDRGRGKQEY